MLSVAKHLGGGRAGAKMFILRTNTPTQILRYAQDDDTDC
jgi:hypothetical protein